MYIRQLRYCMVEGICKQMELNFNAITSKQTLRSMFIQIPRTPGVYAGKKLVPIPYKRWFLWWLHLWYGV